MGMDPDPIIRQKSLLVKEKWAIGLTGFAAFDNVRVSHGRSCALHPSVAGGAVCRRVAVYVVVLDAF